MLVMGMFIPLYVGETRKWKLHQAAGKSPDSHVWLAQIPPLIMLIGGFKHGFYFPYSIYIYILVGGLEPVLFFGFIYGMSSFALTNSYFSRWFMSTTNQHHGKSWRIDSWLVVWECHHLNWRTHIFQRGRSTTNLVIAILADMILGKSFNELSMGSLS